ncbi:5'-methylthioadenosine/adenosylhomocysteine nucleosidase [Paraburkholderia bonniea]|uniref:5'-methylthioadenosine/adenosylhomocysteine nucleosidase n=1 Tax=Paraburkholderia bonniea TaxID=2152891 RepID=UPI002573F1AE|nr:5'-methylthioadenosine/adenosylhomocysteine nucleosidase [Paraburkholderia bonniea]WJF88886.1 5'-methylthioadenosine/adenosylhomocysteine nucleosidase [Paraburkholderia bonniea]WJF92202.1 5'-methylthioadenosine/adenosylhomocysteine nucleosidase [Paraburkholderia bonniea]
MSAQGFHGLKRQVPLKVADGRRPLGVLAALPEELGDLVAAMRAQSAVESITLGRREYHVGLAYGVPCVVTLARVGKVAAAATVSALIHVFDVEAVVFTGVAGGVGDAVRVGDVVVAQTLLQHDLDASPLFARFEVPLLGRTHFAADARLTAQLANACEQFLAQQGAALAARFGVSDVSGTSSTRLPQLHQGLVVSGDQFVASASAHAALKMAVPEALAVEMEGAAIAQICYEYGLPCAVVRTVSDTADHAAPVSFEAFLATLAASYSSGILQHFLVAYQPQPAGS